MGRLFMRQGKLAVALTELGKPSGMNPNVVLSVLKDLPSVWAPIASLDQCRSKLMEVLMQFQMKLMDACKKALAAEDAVKDQKIQGVLALAKDVDNAHETLAALRADGLLGMEAFTQVLARLVAGSFLDVMEEELGKQSGMSPAALLKAVKGCALVWPSMR